MIPNSNDTALQLFCIMVYTVSTALGLLLTGRLIHRHIFPPAYRPAGRNTQKNAVTGHAMTKPWLLRQQQRLTRHEIASSIVPTASPACR